MAKTPNNQSGWSEGRVAVLTATLGALVFILTILVTWRTANGDPATASNIGEMFGTANAIFGAFALVGVVLAIFLQRRDLQLQRKELELQREELRLTRSELARTASAQEKSEEALVAQAKALETTARLTASQYLPILNLKLLANNEGRQVLFVGNTSDRPAYDLSFHIVAGFTDLYTSATEVLGQTTFDETDSEAISRMDGNGYFYISELIKEISLPSNSNLSGKLLLPARSHHVRVLFQFRDVAGSNYRQLYDYGELNGKLDFDFVAPIVPQIASRIDWADSDRISRARFCAPPIYCSDSTDDGELGDFLASWNFSIDSNSSIYWEDLEPRLQLRLPKPKLRY